MTPEESELRRALDARSAAPSSEFRSRLSARLDQGPPVSRPLMAFARSAAALVAVAGIGVLLLAHHLTAPPATGPATASSSRTASPARTVEPTPAPTDAPSPAPTAEPSPAPVVGPTTAVISAPSAHALWVLADGTKLYLSTDEGASWTQRKLPPATGSRPPSISFVDERNGWALFSGSPATQCEQDGDQVWRTSDGAMTWQLDQSVEFGQAAGAGIELAQCKENISFVDPTHGFVTAWDDNHRPTIYRTSDGGVSWSAVTLSDPPDFTTSGGGFVLRAAWVKEFGSALYLEASGSQDSPIHDRQYIFQSTDGGATWSWLEKVPSPYIAMVTQSRWLQLMSPGQSFESNTYGQQWHPYDSDFNSDATGGGPQIVFADSSVGFASGNGALQRTDDGGLHWTRIKTPG